MLQIFARCTFLHDARATAYPASSVRSADDATECPDTDALQSPLRSRHGGPGLQWRRSSCPSAPAVLH